METGSAARRSSFTQWTRAAYGAGRSTVFDGPRWLLVLAVVALVVFVAGERPWMWLALPVVAFRFWLPLGIRWGMAIARSVDGFGEGYRSEGGTTTSAR